MNLGIFIVSTLITAVFTENIVFYQTLGICPFLGVSKKTSNAVGMGLAVTLVIVISSMLSYVLYTYVLVPLGVEFLQLIVTILVIASLVQLLETVIKKFSPSLYRGLGGYLPLIITNCAVLGTALGIITLGYNFIEGVIYALFIGLGFLLALFLMSGVRERTVKSTTVPKCFEGLPLALISGGLIAMAFIGLSGISFF